MASPGRPAAPHVLAAIKAVQAKFPEASPRPTPAPHAGPARAAIAPPAGAARHVAHAVAQARMAPLPLARPVAPPVPPPVARAVLPAVPPSPRPAPAPPPAPAGSRSIQPYSEIKLSGKEGKLSANGHYFVAGGQLWVHAAATAPKACTQYVDKMCPKGKGTYYQWVGATSFLKDCLHTAEEIMAGKTFSYEKGGIRSQSRDSKESIGVSDAENQRIALALSRAGGSVDAGADPAAGEAYLIVEVGAFKTYPYHAAGVVAVDGTDRVTLEMFAGTQDAKDSERKFPGKFEMYGSGAQSFHNTYAGSFTTPATIVLRPK
jgi:hypothetical protein